MAPRVLDNPTTVAHISFAIQSLSYPSLCDGKFGFGIHDITHAWWLALITSTLLTDRGKRKNGTSNSWLSRRLGIHAGSPCAHDSHYHTKVKRKEDLLLQSDLDARTR